MERVYTRFGIDELDSNGVITTYVYNKKKAEDFYYLLVGLNLNDLKKFLIDMELNILNQKESLIKKDVDAYNFLLSEDYDLAHTIDVRYPYLLRNSVFTSTYTLLENALNTVCKLYIQNSGCQSNIKHSKIAIIESAKDFIEKEMDVKLSEREWHLITQYRFVRNAIVHNSGYLSTSGKFTNKAFFAVKKLNDRGLNLNNQRVINLDNTACIQFIELVELFLLNLCKDLPFLD